MVLFCKLCRSRGGSTKFALGTTDLSLEAIKNHLNTNEHKQSESHYSHADQYELNREMFDKEKSSIISLMRNVYFCSKQNLSLNIYPDLCDLTLLQIKNKEEIVINSNYFK